MKKWMGTLWIMSSFSLSAQTKIIKGVVKNAETNEPISQASIKAGDHGVVTNRIGEFIVNADDSVSKIYISSTGFQTDSIQILPATVNYTVYLKQAFNRLD